MSNSANPYLPPAETSSGILADVGAAPGGRIDFQMDLSRNDVRRCYQRKRFGRVPLVLLTLASCLLFLLLLLTAARPGGVVTINWWLLILAAAPLLTVLILVILRQRQWRKAIRQSPSLLGPTSGYLTQAGIHSEQSGVKRFVPWTMLYQVSSNKHGVQMTGDAWRLAGLVIPWESFPDEAAAREAIGSVQRQQQKKKNVPIVDVRKQSPSDDVDVYLPSGPHVTFLGEVTFRQICDSGPGKRLRTVFRRWIIAFCLVLSGGIVGLWWGGQLVSYFGLLAVVFCTILLIRLRKHPFALGNLDMVAIHVRGWVAKDGVYVHAATGQSLRRWSQYADDHVTDSVICLRLPGSVAAWQFIPKSIFTSDEEFQLACQWVAAGMADR